MGYSYNSLVRMVDAKHRFAGKDVLTLGNLFPFVKPGQQAPLAARGIDVSLPKEKFSSHLFTQVLGARSYQSLDVSDYQGSEIIANLNHPLPPEHRGRYDVVVDAGTLEHLANLSTALENIFGLLRPGGIYYFGVPCNNWVDHGFFQFSPTFFRDLCIDNPGLVLDDLYLGTEDRYYDYAAQSPAFLRALLASRHKLNVLGIIRKQGEQLQLDLTQSKYRSLHAGAAPAQPALRKPAHRRLLRAVRSGISSWLSQTALIPLGVKERVSNGLYRMKMRRRQRRQLAAAQRH
ncbi:MAG: class I SAM-dependent methyltransferase [Burkholderiaceae bacterium]|nr:class I SAM-dependent methyltransferase [Burkholderiaceae bacterium]